jgi:hypothetical protein
VLITVAVHDFSLNSATVAAFTSFQINLTILVSITGEVRKPAIKKNKKKPTNLSFKYREQQTGSVRI